MKVSRWVRAPEGNASNCEVCCRVLLKASRQIHYTAKGMVKENVWEEGVSALRITFTSKFHSCESNLDGNEMCEYKVIMQFWPAWSELIKKKKIKFVIKKQSLFCTERGANTHTLDRIDLSWGLCVFLHETHWPLWFMTARHHNELGERIRERKRSINRPHASSLLSFMKICVGEIQAGEWECNGVKVTHNYQWELHTHTHTWTWSRHE